MFSTTSIILCLTLLNSPVQVQCAAEVPDVESYDIAVTKWTIQNTLNNLFSTLKLKDMKQKVQLKQYSTIHDFIVSITLKDHNNLKEIARLTKVDNIDNGSRVFITQLNEVLNEDNKSDEAIDAVYVTNFIDEFHNRLDNLKATYGVKSNNSNLNTSKDIVKHLYNDDENIFDNTTIFETTNDTDVWIDDDFRQPSGRRIFEGKSVKIKRFPFMASVQFFKKFQCGGSIIKSDLVITSASCLQLAWNNRFYRENPAFLSVQVGSHFYEHGGENIAVLEIYFHPNYNPKNLRHNLAILRMTRGLLFGKEYPRIKKIDFDRNPWPLPENTNGIIIVGWGSKGSVNTKENVWANKLSYAVLEYYPRPECQEIYSKEYVTERHFCAGFFSKGGGACNRDAGGPGISRGILMGVISFGAPNCGASDAPTVFTKLGFYAKWIDGIMDMITNSGHAKTTAWPSKFTTFYINTMITTPFTIKPINLNGEGALQQQSAIITPAPTDAESESGPESNAEPESQSQVESQLQAEFQPQPPIKREPQAVEHTVTNRNQVLKEILTQMFGSKEQRAKKAHKKNYDKPKTKHKPKKALKSKTKLKTIKSKTKMESKSKSKTKTTAIMPRTVFDGHANERITKTAYDPASGSKERITVPVVYNKNTVQLSYDPDRNDDISENDPKVDKSENQYKEDKSENPKEDKSELVPNDEKSEHVPNDNKSEHVPNEDKAEHNADDDKSEHNVNNDKSEPAPSDDKSEHVPSDDKSEHVPSEDKSAHNVNDDKLAHNANDDKLEHDRNKEKTGHDHKDKLAQVHNQDKSENVHNKDKIELVHNKDKSAHVHDKDKLVHVHNKDKTEHVHNKDKSEHVHNKDETEQVHNKDKSEHVHNKDKSEHVHKDKSAHLYNKDKLAHVHHKDKLAHVHNKDESENVDSKHKSEHVNNKHKSEEVHNSDKSGHVHNKYNLEDVPSEDKSDHKKGKYIHDHKKSKKGKTDNNHKTESEVDRNKDKSSHDHKKGKFDHGFKDVKSDQDSKEGKSIHDHDEDESVFDEEHDPDLVDDNYDDDADNKDDEPDDASEKKLEQVIVSLIDDLDMNMILESEESSTQHEVAQENKQPKKTKTKTSKNAESSHSKVTNDLTIDSIDKLFRYLAKKAKSTKNKPDSDNESGEELKESVDTKSEEQEIKEVDVNKKGLRNNDRKSYEDDDSGETKAGKEEDYEDDIYETYFKDSDSNAEGDEINKKGQNRNAGSDDYDSNENENDNSEEYKNKENKNRVIEDESTDESDDDDYETLSIPTKYFKKKLRRNETEKLLQMLAESDDVYDLLSKAVQRKKRP